MSKVLELEIARLEKMLVESLWRWGVVQKQIGVAINALSEVRNKTLIWQKGDQAMRLREIHAIAVKALEDLTISNSNSQQTPGFNGP